MVLSKESRSNPGTLPEGTGRGCPPRNAAITRRLEDGSGSAAAPRSRRTSVERCAHKDNKRFVPTDLGRHWIPVIYDLVINGQSARDIAEYLTNSGVPTKRG
jgi:hypothetical protein